MCSLLRNPTKHEEEEEEERDRASSVLLIHAIFNLATRRGDVIGLTELNHSKLMWLKYYIKNLLLYVPLAITF